MPPASLYHPALFYMITISIAIVVAPVASYLSNHKKLKHLLMPLLLAGLSVPGITAVTMIYASHNHLLIQDFWQRLFLFTMSPGYLMLILLFMPCVVFLATAISLLFGYSTDQFLLSKQLTVIKGWAILGIAIPLVLAPIIEEIGWRGYGVDSLRAYSNLFTTSVLFGLLWALWHVPAFFVKGYYQNQLWHLSKVYALNFFASILFVAIFMNWVYYKTGRSIPAIILFHSMINLSSVALKTGQFTKCVVTVILAALAIGLIVYDHTFFFNN